MSEDEKKPLATVSVDLDKYDLMALDRALKESRKPWPRNEDEDAYARTQVTNKLTAAAAKLSVYETLTYDLPVDSTQLDELHRRIREYLKIPELVVIHAPTPTRPFSEDDFRQAFSRLAARRPGQEVLEVSSAPIEPMDLPGEADYSSDLLIAPKHTGPIKVVSMTPEGDSYVALLECPIDSIDFHLKVSDGKPPEES